MMGVLVQAHSWVGFHLRAILTWGNVLEMCCSLRPCLSNLSPRPSTLLSKVLKTLSVLRVFLLSSLFLYACQAFPPNKTHTSNPILGSASRRTQTTHLQLLPFTAPSHRVLRKRQAWFPSILTLVPHSNTDTVPLKQRLLRLAQWNEAPGSQQTKDVSQTPWIVLRFLLPDVRQDPLRISTNGMRETERPNQ